MSDQKPERYQVVEGSQSCHCCFEYTVVDTSKPVMIGNEHWRDQYEPVGEFFDEGRARQVAALLNAEQKA